jgi:hypothetical protein
MFRVRQRPSVVDVVREQPTEPRVERPQMLRIEALEERVAPAQVDYFAKVDYF